MVAATASAARRHHRGGTTRSRLTAAPGGAAAVARPPILLEVVSHSVLYAGFVGQARAKHLVPIVNDEISSSSGHSNTPEYYYRLYSAVIQRAFHLLGGQDIKERRVLVIADIMGPDARTGTPRAWQQAIERILLHDAKAPACSFHSSLPMVPMAFAPPARSSAEGVSQDGMLVVQLTLTEAHCMAHASGQALHYTYQSVVFGGYSASSNTKLSALSKRLSEKRLVRPLLQCLNACPSSVRRAVVHNILFVGVAADASSLSVRVARNLRDVLRRGEVMSKAKDETIEASNSDPTSDPAADSDDMDDATMTPVNLKALQPLAEHVSVVQLSSLRPDLIPWIGASVWSMHWHTLDPQSNHFRWITAAKNSTATSTD